MKNIVIIEQNALYAERLNSILRDHYTVRIYHQGKAFLNELTDVRPDLILTNYALPDIFGLQLVRKVREYYRAVPVIVHDVENDIKAAVASIKEGADDYIVQHENGIHQLYQTMHHYLHGKQHASNKWSFSRIAALF